MTTSLPEPGAPLKHFVSTAPFDPYSVETMSAGQAKIFQASTSEVCAEVVRRVRGVRG